VPDPELPPVTLGMLGMIHAVRVIDGHRAEIELLPTFAGCPATDMMGRDVEAAVRRIDGIDEVAITWRYDPPWSSSRITDEGHEALREFGIAPPVGTDEEVGARPDGRRTLPVMSVDAPAARAPVPCPYCGSTETAQESPFGPTPCRDIRFCEGCQQPFEAFKQL
jgi:ring-1,2-phenylacetyl-CoA epoxidase subunit PaaD